MPSRPSSPCTPSAGALRGCAGVDHHHRPPGAGEHQRAAQPGRAAADHHHVVRSCSDHPGMRLEPARADAGFANSVAEVANWWHGRAIWTRRSTAVGPRLRALRRQRETHAGRAVRRRPASRSARCPGWSPATRRPTLELLLPLARALRGDPRRARRRAADRRPAHPPRARSRRHGMTMLPLTRRAGGIQAYKLVIPAGGRATAAGAEDARGLRVAVRPRRHACASCSASTTWCSRPARRPSSTPGCRTGSAPPTTTAVEFLSLFGRQGERAHLRARPKRT